MSATLPDKPRRILVRGVNWLGDAVMTTPALLRLRERFPDTRIVLATPEKLAGLWPGHPAVDEVLSIAAGESVWSVGKRIRSVGADVAVVFPNSFRTALEVWLGGVPSRIGVGANARGFLLTKVVAPRGGMQRMRKRSVAEIRSLVGGKNPPEPVVYRNSDHQLHHYLHLVGVLGTSPELVAPRLVVSASETQAARERFGISTGGGVWVGLNAGAEYGPAKRWPRERFVAAAIELSKKTGCRWIVFGGKADADLASGITAQIQHGIHRQGGGDGVSVVNVAGQTSLRELCVLLDVCKVVLTNDTGPMHVAAAMGTPVVVPFGSTSPELTGPGLPGDPVHSFLRSNAVCSPCFLRECPVDFRCMQGVYVENVVSAVSRYLDESGPVT
ncbi:MAG TPA: lipopolysaccharide heptosyltransferase II [Roseimicrobium sp.]|nr:lipopolysaccharide heptosyltransferase II [Roseimicrobium sp.]